ncbi:MAG TPA: SDR family NAD(P)-dependent oxidoreductase [Thermodesulfobacteriota bacterium]|nr:SDR family NAD(P)-dependent oxidoreductase [Thermodesulfobacteriota bacterium]
MDIGLKGKKAIVTGGTRGIGRAIANLLIEEGCDIGICARTAAQIEEATAAFKAKGVNSFGSVVDVADGAQLTSFVKSTAEALGGLDIFISNVSALSVTNDEASWKRGFEIDVLGTLRGCETAVPFLEKSGAGAIVVVGSTAAVEVVGPRGPYSSVKVAILPYIKSLALNLAPKKVRANVVSPGTVYFKGGVWNLIEQNMPDRYRQALGRNPMGRMGTPEEVANAVVFLASPRASFITGTNLICDGCITQRVQF